MSAGLCPAGLVLALSIVGITPVLSAQSPIDAARTLCMQSIESDLLRSKSFEPVASNITRYTDDIVSVSVTFHARVVIGFKAKNTLGSCTVTGLASGNAQVCDLTIYAATSNISGERCSTETREVIRQVDQAQLSVLNWRGKWNKKKLGARPEPYRPTATADSGAKNRIAGACREALESHTGVAQLEPTSIETDANGAAIGWLRGKTNSSWVECVVVDEASNPRACGLLLTNHKRPYTAELTTDNPFHIVSYRSECHQEENDWYYPFGLL